MDNKIIVFLSAVILTLISTTLYFTISKNAELGAVAAIGGIFIMTLIVGIALFIAIYFIKLRKEKTGTISTIVFLLVLTIMPMVISPILYSTVKFGLADYYVTEGFITSYSRKNGIEIAPLNQTVAFGHCSLIGISKKYKLMLAKDMNLMFTFEGNDDSLDYRLRHSFRDFETAESDIYGDYLYRIPKGEHILTFNSTDVFTILVQNTKPLLTPSGVLIQEYEYPIIYLEKKNNLDDETREAMESSCIGTPITGNTFLIDEFIFLPGVSQNTYMANETNHVFGFSIENKEFSYHVASDLQETVPESFLLQSDGVKFREVTNKYTRENLTLYLVKRGSLEYYDSIYASGRAGDKTPVDHAAFDESLSSKASLTYEEQLYLVRMQSTFYTNSPISFNNYKIYFRNDISPYGINEIIYVIENMEPGGIKTVTI